MVVQYRKRMPMATNKKRFWTYLNNLFGCQTPWSPFGCGNVKTVTTHRERNDDWAQREFFLVMRLYCTINLLTIVIRQFN